MSRSAAYDKRNALNAICPYFTMFPLEYPLRILAKHKKQNPFIIDPFCGRGTTLFAARSLGLNSYGIDSSPVAVAIAQAKLCSINNEEILNLAANLIERHSSPEIPESTFFRKAFHPTVLREICAIREGLLSIQKDTDCSVILRALMLGCLHGPMSKLVSEQAYFSNQMPRTFASKPQYSVRFWKERNLIARKVKVVDVLARKLSRFPESEWQQELSFKNVRHGDSRNLSSYPKNIQNPCVLITSPPYYGMKTYVEDQWLRNWFLGGSHEISYGNNNQIDHAGHNVFAESLGKVWRNVAKRANTDLHMYVRFGTIPSVKSDPKKLVLDSFEASKIDWKVVSIRGASTAESGKRQATQMDVRTKATVELDFHFVVK